mgnify:CR=1 FL=1
MTFSANKFQLLQEYSANKIQVLQEYSANKMLIFTIDVMLLA